MLGSVIVMLIGFWVLSLVGGMLIGKMLWTPPIEKGVK
jgi:hypothetical protein